VRGHHPVGSTSESRLPGSGIAIPYGPHDGDRGHRGLGRRADQLSRRGTELPVAYRDPLCAHLLQVPYVQVRHVVEGYVDSRVDADVADITGNIGRTLYDLGAYRSNCQILWIMGGSRCS
jgi:hypothetical protein